MSKLEEKIIQKGIKIIESINESAVIEAKALKEKLIEAAKVDLVQQLKKEASKSDQLIKQAKQDSERLLRDEVAISKQQLIESIFTTLKAELKDLKPEDYFHYVVESIKSEQVPKDAEIRVNKKDYALYSKILSSKKGDLIDADILNEALGKGYQLKLSHTPIQIESGFMVIGKLYDLNFSLETRIENLSKKYEKTIYEALN
jgi:V/A-type H+-transporting ATPase subunit E